MGRPRMGSDHLAPDARGAPETNEVHRGDPLRVAWLCPYPAVEFSHRPALKRVRLDVHPTPWITLQAPLVAASPGIELHVITVGKGFDSDDHFTDRGIHFHFLKVPRIPRALMLYQMDRVRMARCVQALEPDVVQAFGTEDSYALTAVTCGVPVITRLQGIQSQIVSAMSRAMLRPHPGVLVSILFERWTIRRCNHFITPTRFAEQFVRAINPRAVTYRISTPVREEFFQISRSVSPEPEVLYVGTLLPAKGIHVLLRAFADLKGWYPNARLVLIGAAPDRSYMERVVRPLSRTLGISDRLDFRGAQSAGAVATAMGRASMLVLPTMMDTAPNVIAEAQVVGTPIIASAVGGIPDMIENGVSGLLTHPGDSAALADAIRQYLDDYGFAERLSLVARERARPQHRPQTQVEKLVRIYREIVGDVEANTPSVSA